MCQEQTAVFLQIVLVCMSDTPGRRLYAIRLLLGDGFKNPMPADDFAELVKRRGGGDYDPSTISRLENGKRRWLLEDATRLSLADPLGRGERWLAFGAENASTESSIREPVAYRPRPPEVAARPRRRQG